MTTEILGYIADPEEAARVEHQRIKRVKKELYFTRQRIIGMIALIVGIIAPAITHEGIVASFLLIPYGIIMVLNNNKMITEEDINEEEYHKRTV